MGTYESGSTVLLYIRTDVSWTEVQPIAPFWSIMLQSTLIVYIRFRVHELEVTLKTDFRI